MTVRQVLTATAFIIVMIAIYAPPLPRDDATADELARLKEEDPAAWSARLRAADERTWWPTLIAAAERDPDRFGPILDEERKRRAFASKVADRQRADAAIRAAADLCTDEAAAYAAAQDFVSRHLRSPATADFPWPDEIVIRPLGGAPCGRQLTGHVDSQNGFGAIVRSEWTLAIRVADDASGWTLEDIAVVDR